jgi:hypothetical protein
MAANGGRIGYAGNPEPINAAGIMKPLNLQE